jgi:hypothetical protein
MSVADSLEGRTRCNQHPDSIPFPIVVWASGDDRGQKLPRKDEQLARHFLIEIVGDSYANNMMLNGEPGVENGE